MNDADISNRLIVALDVPSGKQALELVAELQGSVKFFKVGLELIASGDGLNVIDELVGRGFQVFADFKFLDIPQTVYRAVRNLNRRGISFLTVHAEEQTMQAAVDAAEDISILAVTVLTSLSDAALQSMGFTMSTADLVQFRAHQVRAAGCSGVISSPNEASAIRRLAGRDFLIVTPGIRAFDKSNDDQARTMSIAGALEAGADYFVIGRPIRDAANPKKAALKFQNEILKFESSSLNSA